MSFPLTNVDPLNPTPGYLREIRYAQGASGGSVEGREAVILCSKTSSGTGSVHTLYGPISDRSDVIDKFGYHSEGLLLFDTFRAANKTTPLYLIATSVAGSAPTRNFAFSGGSATANTSIRIRHLGEIVEVGVAQGDSVATQTAAVAAAINNKLTWVFSATDNASAVLLTASTSGLRFDHYLTYTRMDYSKSAGTTITPGSVSSGTTDDDQTDSLAALDTKEIYYQINPKTATGAVTSTDNGLGEHKAQITVNAEPLTGNDQVLIFGAVSTNANAASVANSVNSPISFCVWAENNDFSPGMLAARYGAVKAAKESVHPAANLTDYGLKPEDSLNIPAPYADTDRATDTEIVVALNNGVTPIRFTANGQSYICRDVTTYSKLGSAKDYRCREGHIPSCMAAYSQMVKSSWLQQAQDFVADDPVEGEKPKQNTSYPRDFKAVMAKAVDDMVNYPGGPVLDPLFQQEMKDTIEVDRLTDGLSGRCFPVAVKHNNRTWALFLQSDAEY